MTDVRCEALFASPLQGSDAVTADAAAAAISGKALLEDLIPIEELQPFLPNA